MSGENRRLSRFGPDVQPGIQGLRGVAVLAVIVYHASPGLLRGGYIGVDVFFVISGYLITRQLVEDYPARDRADLARFYARRAARILPAALFVLLATLLAWLAVTPGPWNRDLVKAAVSAALFASNLYFARKGEDYLADHSPSPFQHYWSLSIEEQFYLCWPLLLWALMARGRRLAAAVAAALIALSLALCILQTWRDTSWAFYSPLTRAWEFLVGAMLVWAGRPTRARVAAWLGWLGLALILGSAAWFNERTRFPGFIAVLPVAGAAMVLCHVNADPRRVGPFPLGAAPLRWLGDISYSAYLWHWPVLLLALMLQAEGPPSPLFLAALVAVTLLAADLTRRFVEQPFRRSSGRALAAPAFGAFTLVFVVAGACVAGVFDRPLQSTRVAPAFVPGNAITASFVPANVVPALSAAEADLPRIYLDGCHSIGGLRAPCVFGPRQAKERIVLFGDSHAAQWFPAAEAYARERGASLAIVTRSACPAVAAGEFPSKACHQWLDQALRMIAALQPTLVLVANYSRYRDRPEVARWAQGLRKTLDSLPALAEKVVIADTPSFSRSPVTCLAIDVENTSRCHLRREYALDAAWAQAERATARAAGAAFIDFNDLLCGDTCPPIAGNVLVYRDSHHLTAVMSAALAAEFARRINHAPAR